MVKFVIVLSLASVATAINSHHGLIGGIGMGGVGIGHGYGGIGGIGLGYPGLGASKYIGSSIGGISHMGGLGMSKSISSVAGSSIGALSPYGIGTGIGLGHHIGMNKAIHGSSIGVMSPLGIGGLGAHLGHGVGPMALKKAYHTSSIGGLSSIGGIGGLGGIGVNKAIATSAIGGVSPLGLGLAAKSASIGHHHGIHSLGGIGALGGIGSFGGIGHMGLGGHHAVSRLSHMNHLSIPGGYYGGLLAYPQAIPAAVSASALHIPGAAVDAFKGYFGGYFPGSIGYGHSYRFFH